MQTLQSVDVASQLAGEREASLRLARPAVGRQPSGEVRRWLGNQLIRAGTWLTRDQSMQPAGA